MHKMADSSEDEALIGSLFNASVDAKEKKEEQTSVGAIVDITEVVEVRIFLANNC